MSNDLIKNSTFYYELKSLIEESRNQTAVFINSAITMLYWNIGKRINIEILKDKRAEYGKQIVQTLSEQLTKNMVRAGVKTSQTLSPFCGDFSDEEIVSTLRRQLSWTHFKELIYINEPLKRNFYIEMCKLERWSVRTLRDRINSMLFERTAISKKPEDTIKQELEQLKQEQKLSPDLVFRDPYILDFLGLSDKYSEKDLESAILNELKNFIVELGNDFAFLARQKRITIDNDDYYIDLLFYHRRLKCLVAIELKLGRFKAEYKGQMELYLKWLKI